MGSKVLEEVAPALGLKARGPWLFGRYRGFPVALKEGAMSDGYRIVFQVALTPEAIPGVTAAIADPERVKSLGFKPAAMRIEPSVGELVYVHTPLVRTKAEDVSRFLEGLATLAAAGGPPLGDVCEKCRQNPAGDVFLLNGLPTQLCSTDAEAIRGQIEEAQAVAQSLRPSYAKGIGFGLAGTILGAGIWAAIGIATGYIFSLAAFGISFLIAFLLSRGAGVVTMPLTVVMVALTMLAIFLGDVLWVGVLIAQFGGPFDLGLAFQGYMFLVREDPSLLLSYLFGLLGVLGTASYMTKTARRSRAGVEVIT